MVAPNDILVRGSDGIWESVPVVMASGADGVMEQVWPVRVYLIQAGVINTENTGGMVWKTVVGTPSAYQRSGYLELQNYYTAGSTNYYMSNRAISLDGKSKLYVTYERYGNGSHGLIGLFTGNAYPNNTHYVVHNDTGAVSKQTVCISFTPASGKYLGIGVGTTGGTATVRVYDIWIE